MTQTIGDLTVREFLDRLAAPASESGGGAAAAVAGAMAAALLRMVGSLGAARKDATKDARRDWPQQDAELARDQADLLGAAGHDGESWAAVLAARRLPRATAQETELRRQKLQAALAVAARLPLEVADCCFALECLCPWLEAHGAPAARSDIACALELARAARSMALHTARINIAALDGGPLREGLEIEACRLAPRGEP